MSCSIFIGNLAHSKDGIPANVIHCGFNRAKKEPALLGGFYGIRFQPRIFSRSFSGVLMGVNANFSTRTSSTFDEKNAGSDGPI
jgi:hypothetical protein